MRYLSWLLVPLLAACGDSSISSDVAAGKQATFEIFVMSQCPYGVQVEQAMDQVVAKLGSAVAVRYDYIGDGEAGALQSMHGPPELKGDIAQLCATKLAADKSLAFIACQNENPREVDTNWKACGEKLGFDAAALATCVDGDEGQQLAAASFAKAKAKGAQGSPTIFLNDQPYEGGRRPTDFLRAVCKELGADAPKACADLPVPPQFEAIFLSDSRCPECDIRQVEGKLSGTFAGVKVVHLDAAMPEGREFYDRLRAADPQFQLLPAILLSPDAKRDTDGYPEVERFVRPVGEYLELRMGGKFDPTAEICDNGADDDGDAKVDCADDGCAGSMTCRPALAKKLDLFVMSQCPYGAKALIATDELVREFGSDVDVDVHFIGDDQGGALTSMHGPPEVEYDLYEICAQKVASSDAQSLRYMACISRNYRTPDLAACAKEAKLDAGAIASCATGAEGQQLLRASFAEAAALNIGSSPTFLSNNRRTFNAVAVGPLQSEYCRDNPGLAACAKVIAETPETAAPTDPAECGN